jgi:hypothetical protein
MPVAYVGPDSIPHVVDKDDRDLVLRARAMDRADNVDSARILYERARSESSRSATGSTSELRE